MDGNGHDQRLLEHDEQDFDAAHREWLIAVGDLAGAQRVLNVTRELLEQKAAALCGDDAGMQGCWDSRAYTGRWFQATLRCDWSLVWSLSDWAEKGATAKTGFSNSSETSRAEAHYWRGVWRARREEAERWLQEEGKA